MDAYTTKPVGKMELLRTLAHWVHQSGRHSGGIPGAGVAMSPGTKAHSLDTEKQQEELKISLFNASIVTRDASMVNFLGANADSAIGGGDHEQQLENLLDVTDIPSNVSAYCSIGAATLVVLVQPLVAHPGKTDTLNIKLRNTKPQRKIRNPLKQAHGEK
jgi:hypothetical protein